MARVVFLCMRQPGAFAFGEQRLNELNRRLCPDHLTPAAPALVTAPGLALAILNPSGLEAVQGASVCLGNMPSTLQRWAQPGGQTPDGSFALLRSDETHVELVTDVVGSRSLWYYLDDERLLASDSQRALVMLLGSLQFNPQAVNWMLSSGTLGAENSWDERITCLGPDARLVLNRQTWKTRLQRGEVRFNPVKLRPERQMERIQAELEETFAGFHPDARQWVLALSGGYDSRCILLMLKERLPAITWGLRAALADPQSDAAVAAQLAAQFGLEHTYFQTDASTGETSEQILRRFLALGEGRVDNLGGYMDGFRLWKTLAEAGVRGVVRGDEGFGWVTSYTAFDVRRYLGLTLLSDYPNLWAVCKGKLPAQTLPDGFGRKRGETLPAWRDRLYHTFRLPYVLAALNDLKTHYVEICNPLLSRGLIEAARTLPDRSRTEKREFKRLIRQMLPDVPFARRSAIEQPANLLRSPGVAAALAAGLSSPAAQAALPDELLRWALKGIRSTGRSSSLSWKARLKKLLPRSILIGAKSLVGRLDMDVYVLAWRMYVVCEMKRLLSEDAAWGAAGQEQGNG